MSHIDPYHLQNVIQQWMGSQPRIEPTMSGAPAGPEGVAPPVISPDRNLRAVREGESAVDAEMDKANTESWSQRMKEARDAANPKAARKRADKAATQDWINKMRGAREGQKAVGKELASAPNLKLLTPPVGSPDRPAWASTLYDKLSEGGRDPVARLAGEGAVEDELFPPRELYPAYPPSKPTADPRAGPAGEDAVRQSLTDMNMKPLIDHAIAVQEAQARAQAIKDFIASQMATEPPQLPDSQIPENTNRPPGSENTYVTAHDYSMLPETAPGVRGVLNTPPLRTPQMPPPANLPLFPPQGPHDPNLTQGPHVRSPGKPEDETPPVE